MVRNIGRLHVYIVNLAQSILYNLITSWSKEDTILSSDKYIHRQYAFLAENQNHFKFFAYQFNSSVDYSIDVVCKTNIHFNELLHVPSEMMLKVRSTRIDYASKAKLLPSKLKAKCAGCAFQWHKINEKMIEKLCHCTKLITETAMCNTKEQTAPIFKHKNSVISTIREYLTV